jgi:hypothetical protein
MVDTMVKADDNVTKLSHFEERYRTRGDFEVMVFKQQTGTSVAAAIEGGFFDRLRLFLIMDDLGQAPLHDRSGERKTGRD